MPSGKAVVNLRIATTEQWRDKQTGENKEATEWHNVVMFDRLAEIAAEYLRKGSQIFVEGKIRTRKWQDKEGNDRYTTEIIANEMSMLGGRGAGDRSSAPPQDRSRERGEEPGIPPRAGRRRRILRRRHSFLTGIPGTVILFRAGTRPSLPGKGDCPLLIPVTLSP